MKLAMDPQMTNDINIPCHVGEMFEVVWHYYSKVIPLISSM